jgi:hypothetical protein
MQQSESFKATTTTFLEMGHAEKARAILWQKLKYYNNNYSTWRN